MATNTNTELKVLNKKRGSVKTKLTNFSTFVHKIKTDRDNGIQISDALKIQLEERTSNIQSLLADSFEPLQNEIDLLSEDVSEQLSERSEFENNFYEFVAEAKLLIEELKPKGSNNSLTTGVSVEGSDGVTGNISDLKLGISQSIKLPDIKLPSFNGAHETWLEFRDLFVSMIHENKDINQIQKFHYLRASLEGSAAQVIKSLEFSADNYLTAWDLVCKRFENKKLLIHNHVEALFNLGKLDKGTATSVNIRRIIDTVSKHLRSLESLNMPTDHWDVLITHIIVKGLDDSSISKWEEYKFQKEIPSLNDMFEFLKNRADLLERLEISRHEQNKSFNKGKGRTLFSSNESNRDTNKEKAFKKCDVCSGDHLVYLCEKFNALTVSERIDQANKLKLCHRCLRPGHFTKSCRLFGACKTCHSKKHNTLLHTSQDPPVGLPKTTGAKGTDSACVTTCCSSTVPYNIQTLLSTAILNIFVNDKAFPVRAVLDSGSQSSYVSESVCNKLGLKKEKIILSVSGINNRNLKLHYRCSIEVSSRHYNYKTRLICLVLPEITSSLPAVELDIEGLGIPQGIQLADENFYKPGPIDMLIGADLFWNLLINRQFSLGFDRPVLQETLLGWVISGKTGGRTSGVTKTKGHVTFCKFSQSLNTQGVQEQLEKFFEIENVTTKGKWSAEEIECEAHFVNTTIRLPNGRFQVSIPFKKSIDHLGESFEQAKYRLHSIERKFAKNPTFKDLYSKYLESYESLGKMRKVPLSTGQLCYYLPHHGVLRDESKTTKLRVVFDASARTATNVSLNDLQMKGPVIQDDILTILLRFRQHRYVVTADIEKMYLQVLVTPEQRNLQRILWRNAPTEELSVYELLTVTFGMTSSPFLATRCLKELAQECKIERPHIAEIIEHDFYVDDLLTGFDDLNLAKDSCLELSNVLSSGCFPLRKWRTNEPEILQNLRSTFCAEQSELSFGDEDISKTLGLAWSSKDDQLAYKINVSINRKVTKRVMLSCIARLFDPLGLLSPCTILAKVMLQKLWQHNLEWDAAVSFDLQNSWNRFMGDLNYLNNLRIGRHVICANSKRVELHAFSDASEVAFGACVYILSEDETGKKYCHLLMSKSKVAPIKALTIPRLELCAAYVLAKLVEKVTESLRLNFDKLVFWTDSKIILGWINTSTNLLKPFVRNRIAEIQELTQAAAWRYVPSAENPADVLSREESVLQTLLARFYGGMVHIG